jgi:hypothetical protein
MGFIDRALDRTFKTEITNEQLNVRLNDQGISTRDRENYELYRPNTYLDTDLPFEYTLICPNGFNYIMLDIWILFQSGAGTIGTVWTMFNSQTGMPAFDYLEEGETFAAPTIMLYHFAPFLEKSELGTSIKNYNRPLAFPVLREGEILKITGSASNPIGGSTTLVTAHYLEIKLRIDK